MCPHYRGVLSTRVSTLQRCPHYRGVLTTEVSSLQRCPHYRCPNYRGVLTTEVSSIRRCSLYRRSSLVSSLQGCPHYSSVLATEVSSLQRCPHNRGVSTTARGVPTTEVSSLHLLNIRTIHTLVDLLDTLHNSHLPDSSPHVRSTCPGSSRGSQCAPLHLSSTGGPSLSRVSLRTLFPIDRHTPRCVWDLQHPSSTHPVRNEYRERYSTLVHTVCLYYVNRHITV